MVFFLKAQDDAEKVLQKVQKFLTERHLEYSPEKTKLSLATDGFDFLGWHFKVQKNGKFRSTPSEDNYQKILKKIKTVANSSNYGAEVKAKKLAPIVRGWRNYHRNCKMDGSRNSLWFANKAAHRKFLKQKSINRKEAEKLIKKAFPAVSWKENNHVMVKGTKSPYDGNLVYWSKRKSKLYDNATSKALTKQNHSCGHCGLKFVGEERIHLHHIDGNHDNWKPKNLMAVHQSCHQYIHGGKSFAKRHQRR
ncbi:group II intron maturase-specific domain-containing protein [Moorena sp. SIO3I6]|uniref:group II intron reverse transcriptase n=1 Tax=Moorena sp. SIO3I6 TaxID=2607831 RepID=UPI003450D139